MYGLDMVRRVRTRPATAGRGKSGRDMDERGEARPGTYVIGK